jgi:ribosomal protein S18 acetylase RimI-like enzyme
MTVVFHKSLEPPPHSWWEARRSTGGRLSGGHMPIGRGVIPHDLVHLATEAELDLAFGFWGLLAQGATFHRGTDGRRTRPGRALIAAHRAELDQAEALGNAHHHAWRTGQPTPLAATFDSLAEEWSALPDGGTLRVDWPGLARAPKAGPASGAAAVDETKDRGRREPADRQRRRVGRVGSQAYGSGLPRSPMRERSARSTTTPSSSPTPGCSRPVLRLPPGSRWLRSGDAPSPIRAFAPSWPKRVTSVWGPVAVRADPDDRRCAQLRRLHVLPDHWGRGVGSALYAAAMVQARTEGYREAVLWVLEDNSRARSFYEPRGWDLVPDRRLEWPGLGTIEVRYKLPLRPSLPEAAAR